jgi:hypothetical protein
MKLKVDGELFTDPDLRPGAFLTLERADGRSVWRQRLRVKRIHAGWYVMEPVAETEGFLP